MEKRITLRSTLARRSAGFALLFSLFYLGGPAGGLRACNLSYVQLDSVVEVSGDWDIYLTVCMGAGVTGTSRGADINTVTFDFAFYSSCMSSISFSYFTPQVTGDVTGNTYSGLDYGPVGSPYNSQGNIVYYHPSYLPFVCVSSTYLCGHIHSQCDQYRFRVSDMPDSVRVLGVEGNANLLAGCYPNPDMMVDLPDEGNPCSRQSSLPVLPDPQDLPATMSASGFFGPAQIPTRPDIRLYPNPNSGSFTVEVPGLDHARAHLRIHDLTGRTVREMSGVELDGPLPIEAANGWTIAPGTYFLTLSGEGWHASKLFTIH